MAWKLVKKFSNVSHGLEKSEPLLYAEKNSKTVPLEKRTLRSESNDSDKYCNRQLT